MNHVKGTRKEALLSRDPELNYVINEENLRYRKMQQEAKIMRK